MRNKNKKEMRAFYYLLTYRIAKLFSNCFFVKDVIERFSGYGLVFAREMF